MPAPSASTRPLRCRSNGRHVSRRCADAQRLPRLPGSRRSAARSVPPTIAASMTPVAQQPHGRGDRVVGRRARRRDGEHGAADAALRHADLTCRRTRHDRRGTVNTLARLAPSRKEILQYISSIASPPATPTPTTQPILCPACSSGRSDCASACLAATIASTLKRSNIGNRRASSIRRGSGAGMAPTVETFKSEGAELRRACPRPQRPSCRADQNASTEWPSAETQPAPVTTICSCFTAASFKTEQVAQRNKVCDGLVGVPRLESRIFGYGRVACSSSIIIMISTRSSDVTPNSDKTDYGLNTDGSKWACLAIISLSTSSIVSPMAFSCHLLSLLDCRPSTPPDPTSVSRATSRRTRRFSFKFSIASARGTAGYPAYTAPAGTLVPTQAAAPTTAQAPIVRWSATPTRPPSTAPSPIITPPARPTCPQSRQSIPISTLWPIITRSSILVP